MFVCSTAIFTLTLATGGISMVNEYLLPLFSLHNPFKAENDMLMGKDPNEPDSPEDDIFGKDAAALDATRFTSAMAQTPNLDPKKMTIGDVPPHTPRDDAPVHHHAVHNARASIAAVFTPRKQAATAQGVKTVVEKREEIQAQ
jgi:hypothetical protein